jgi:hypothetical protein
MKKAAKRNKRCKLEKDSKMPIKKILQVLKQKNGLK